MIDQVRARVAELLGELDGVVGLRKKTEGTAPYLFKQGDDLSSLALSPRYPLAPIVSLLHKRYPEVRLGVVARACDVRALVEMAKRMQIDPQRLHILGLACSADETEACYCTDPAFRIEGWPQAEVIGTPAEAGPPNPIVAEHEGMSLAERKAFWQGQFRKCIKCYGCRNICPECFCENCSLENPLWVEKGILAPPFPTYHLIRAMHMSARCVACRQCELVCPAHIPLTILHDLIRRDVEALMSYVPGMDMEARPPMSLTLDEVPIQVELE
jgi:formate dehydrogenase subunit beta